MGKVYDAITPSLETWIGKQHVFFVATAPLSATGHVNVSPRGGAGTFSVLDDRTVAWLDLTGSGAETIAHLRENGRIVVMFCAFEGPPKIVRLHGFGRVVLPEDGQWDRLVTRFPDKAGARAIVVVDVTRVSDSCGFAVPRMDFAGDRDLLDAWTAKRDDEALADYRATRNRESIDGLPAIGPALTQPPDVVHP